MASSGATASPVKSEYKAALSPQSSPQLPSSPPTLLPKQDSQKLQNTTDQRTTETYGVQQPRQSPPPPNFAGFTSNLYTLSTALSAFRRCYNDLEQHIESTRNSIESKLPRNFNPTSLPPQYLAVLPPVEKPSTTAAKTPAPELACSQQHRVDEKSPILPQNLYPISLPLQELPNTADQPKTETSESQQSRQSQLPPNFIGFITNLHNLSTAISAFQRCYNDLEQHIESIRNSIPISLPPQYLAVLPPIENPSTSASKTPAAKLACSLQHRVDEKSPMLPQNLNPITLPPQDMAVLPPIEIPSPSTAKTPSSVSANSPNLSQEKLNSTSLPSKDMAIVPAIEIPNKAVAETPAAVSANSPKLPQKNLNATSLPSKDLAIVPAIEMPNKAVGEMPVSVSANSPKLITNKNSPKLPQQNLNATALTPIDLATVPAIEIRNKAVAKTPASVSANSPKLPRKNLNATSLPPKDLAIVPAIEIPNKTTAKRPGSESVGSPALPRNLNTTSFAPKHLAIVPAVEIPNKAAAKTPAFFSANSQRHQTNEKPLVLDVKHICRVMNGRSLRKYLMSHLGKMDKLRQEVPAALKLAPNPAKLVIECLGRFFLMGSKAFIKNSPMIPGRQASVLILEHFLLMEMEGIEIKAAEMEEAESAAVAWRKRLIREGGLAKSCEIDARGLLLLVGCFGIPRLFENEDLKNLILGCNPKAIYRVVRRSSVLQARVPEVIEWMLKHKMEVAAVGVIYNFGVEDRFSPHTILMSFLQETKENWTRQRKAANVSLSSKNEANKKKLADLKSVVKCLAEHKIDASNFLAGWQINEKISNLEKEISDYDANIREKVTSKRKAAEPYFMTKMKTQKLKHSRFAGQASQHQKAADYADGWSSYSSYESSATTELLDGAYLSHINPHTASLPILCGSGTRSMSESILRSVPGSGDGVIATGGRAGFLAAATGVGEPIGSYAGAHGGLVVVDSVRQPYGWRGHVGINGRMEGQGMAGQPAPIAIDYSHRPSPFGGLLNAASANDSRRGTNSDLYQFADAVW